ncbi:MAG: UbiA family prenyltransferase [Candidatus Aenigmarchaeota archaeon]|nr:UbiA family prenyltransferase [Candidatus Aenigmarchaeota archaeon]
MSSDLARSATDFLHFIRIKVSIILSLVTIAGYFMFHPPGIAMAYAVLASFFIYTGCYAYNNMTDLKEDKVNRRKISPLASGKMGYLIVLASNLAGLSFSFLLSAHIVLLSLITMLLGILYSSLRIKKYLMLKNVVTAIIAAASFLFGALAAPPATPVAPFYLLLFAFFLIGSIVSDMRDYRGDKAAGFKTLPVRIGYQKTKAVLLIMLFAYSLAAFFAGFLVLLPFIAFILLSLHKDKPAKAHTLGGAAFIFLAAWFALAAF